MPLFLLRWTDSSETHRIYSKKYLMTLVVQVMWYTVDEGEQLVNACDVGGLIGEVKVSTDIDHFPLGLEPMPDARIESSRFIFSPSNGLVTYHSV
jgi:hypothetical protein